MKNEKGFSLVGIIVSLAIIALIATMVLPRTAKSILREHSMTEQKLLDSFGENIRSLIMDQGFIPGGLSWSSDISLYASMSPAKITTTYNGLKRIYVYPSNFISATSTLPYDQNANAANGIFLTAKPVNAKLMIISNLGSKPLTTTSGVLASFDNVWSQSGAFPAELTESDSLVIERINLTDMFIPVTLNNNDAALQAKWSIGAAPIQNLAPQTSQTYWFLKGTKLKLFDGNGNLYYSHTVVEPVSFTFSGMWGGILGSPGSVAGNNIGSIFDQNQNGLLTNWGPAPGCTSGGTFTLTVNASNSMEDYYVYAGIGGVATYLGKVQAGNTKTFGVGGCDLVAIVPKPGGANSIFVFYMPNNPKTVVLP